MKYEVRVSTEITFDFIVEAIDEDDAEDVVVGCLMHVPGGKAEGQCISLDCQCDGDKVTNIFIMDVGIEDVNAL